MNVHLPGRISNTASLSDLINNPERCNMGDHHIDSTFSPGQKQKQRKYYFINKDGSSPHVTVNSAFERSAINSYVQTGRKRNRRSRAAVTRKAPLQDTRGFGLTGSQNEVSSKAIASGPHTTDPGRREETKSNEWIMHTSNISNTKMQSQVGQNVPKQQDAPEYVKSLISQTIFSRIDPFKTASVQIDKTIHGLLQYFVHIYHPTTWPNELSARSHGLYVFKDAVEDLLTMVLEDKLAMYCLLSAAACRLQYVDRLEFPEVTGKECWYIHKAIHLIRLHINEGSFADNDQKNRMLIYVFFLLSAESYRNNNVAARTHLQAAVKLLESRGGIMALDNKNLQGQLLMADLYQACVNLEPCLFGSDYDPGPAATLQLKEYELHAIKDHDTGIALLAKDSVIVPSNLRVLIQRIVESYSIKTRLQIAAMSPLRITETTHWITKRNMAIRNQLLALATSDLRVHALRTALIMWTLLSMNLTGRKKTIKVMAPALRAIMDRIPSCDWSGNKDVAFWILLLGYASAQEGSEDSNWFFEQCSKLVYLQNPSKTIQESAGGVAEQLERFQRSFFFHPEVQRPLTLELAQEFAQLQVLCWR